MKYSYLVFLLAVSAFLSSCSTVKDTFSNESPQLVASPDSVTSMLASAADRASTALETLAAVEYARTPTPESAPVTDAPPELARAITVNWVGPAENIIKRLADRASFNFIVTGNPPAVPVVVSVDIENRPVVEVLRNVGLQMGTRATVRVDAESKRIELQYPPNTGVGQFY